APSSSPTILPPPVTEAPSSSSPTLSPTSLSPTSATPTITTQEPTTGTPSLSPTDQPTTSPTGPPSAFPTHSPSSSPTLQPSQAPTRTPSEEPTLAPSGSPTAAPSVPLTDSPSTLTPTLTPTLSPTVPPTPFSPVATGQSFSITFSTLSYTDLSANGTYLNLVIDSYKSAVASGAGVPSSQVGLTSLYAGSTVFDTVVNYTAADLESGADPAAFSLLLADSAATVFAGSTVLGSFSSGASATTVVTEGLSPTGSPITPIALAAPEGSFGSVGPGAVPSGSVALPSDGGESTDLSAEDADPCSPSPCSASPEVPCIAGGAAGTFECGTCPAGYEGDGATCTDVDECAEAGRGGCDPNVVCTNTPGGYSCGECPAGMLGSGAIRCLPQTACSEDNGGCDLLTSCQDADSAGGGVTCGACPEGYSGTGATGCMDENGCEAAGEGACFQECIDVLAPGTGHTCAPCPACMVGDGRTCVVNACCTDNGGCDSVVTCAVDAGSGSVTCGECPSGQALGQDPVLSDKWRCADVDGCAAEPCWSDGEFSQPCEDVAAPGSGRVCGACPSGFIRTGVEGEAGCADVNECEGAANGGCWVLSEDPTVRTECVNAPGGHSCTACPERYIGTGEAGCRERVMCDTNHGNCDLLASCADNLATGYADCGPCPEGYSGTGATACVDTDGCALEPCFPGVECADVAAPGIGRTCGSCPEGYRGNGASCEMCVLQLSLNPLMATVVDGAMKRSAVNQLVGTYGGLNEPDCVNTQGVQYMWEGVTSGGEVVPLRTFTDPEVLSLYLPRSTLTANVRYSLRLTASLRGARGVSTTVDSTFEVRRQPLVALIQGGPVQTGEGLPVALDAGVSYDPDNEPGEMNYVWSCTLLDGSGHCRDVAGALLPTRMTTASLSLTLAGSQEGSRYTLTVEVAKDERVARASTTVVIMSGAPPVPSILPLPHKHTANMKLTLSSVVTSLRPDSLALGWSIQAPEAMDLAAVAATPLNLLELVVRPGALTPGGSYVFTLTAEDDFGPSWVSLEVKVNSPPHSGRLLPPTPSVGVMAETEFSLEGHGWEDDVEDKPLWYQLRYLVVGGPVEADPTMLSQWQPSPMFSARMPVAGLESFDRTVTVYLYVKDALEATTHVTQSITVQPMAFADDSAEEAYINGAINSAAQDAANGQDSTTSLLAMASLLNEGQGGVRRRGLLSEGVGGNVSAAHLKQVETMLEVTSTVWGLLPSTTDTVTRMADCMAQAARNPVALTEASRLSLLASTDSMVATTLSGDPDAQLAAQGAGALLSGLSSVAVGALGGANQSAEVAAAVDVVRNIGHSSAQGLVPGEDAVEVATETLSSVVQCEDLSAGGATARSPTGTVVEFQPSLGKALGAAAARVTVQVVGSAIDPHRAAPPLPGDDSDAERVFSASNVTSISLYGGNGSELAVHGLEEALTFTLPIHIPEDADLAGSEATANGRPFLGAQCKYWDDDEGLYRSDGCVTLPNPTPPGSAVFWHTLNVTELAPLETAWAVEDSDPEGNLTLGCEVSWEATFPEYLGMDAGLRKYLGTGCQLADPENAVGCWWEWRTQSFEGDGCVWAKEAACLCTHLTDFAAAQQTEVGGTQPPDRVSSYSTDDMTRLNMTELKQSVVLLSVLAIFMLGAPLMYFMSNYFHNRERLQLLLKMVDSQGQTFREIESMWTWSIVDRQAYNVSRSAGKPEQSLGSLFADIAAKEKARLDAERAGMLIGVKAASKWKSKRNRNNSNTASTASVDSNPEPAPAEASQQESALQQRLKKAWKRSALTNMMSTGAGVSLKTKQERKEEAAQKILQSQVAEEEPKPPSPSAPALVEFEAEPPEVTPPATASQAWKYTPGDVAIDPTEIAAVDYNTVTCKIQPPEPKPVYSSRIEALFATQRDAPALRQMTKSHRPRPLWPSTAPRRQLQGTSIGAGAPLRELIKDAQPEAVAEPPAPAAETTPSMASSALAAEPLPSMPHRKRSAGAPCDDMPQASQTLPGLHPGQGGASYLPYVPSPSVQAEVVPGPMVSVGTLEEPGTPMPNKENLVLEETITTVTTRRIQLVRPSGAVSAGPVMESYHRLSQDGPEETGAAGSNTGHEEAEAEVPERAQLSRQASVGVFKKARRMTVNAMAILPTTMLSQQKTVSIGDLKRGEPGKAVAKKKAPTARSLFNAMSINIFRLQLCIPLDYLEEQALLEMKDDRRRKRRDDLSAQSKNDAGDQ
ncbi:hypothetical protein CYMTET_33877, partial [Cymbomonas tetramitiformis]